MSPTTGQSSSSSSSSSSSPSSVNQPSTSSSSISNHSDDHHYQQQQQLNQQQQQLYQQQQQDPYQFYPYSFYHNNNPNNNDNQQQQQQQDEYEKLDLLGQPTTLYQNRSVSIINCEYKLKEKYPHMITLIFFFIIYITIILLGASLFMAFEAKAEQRLRDQIMNKQQLFLQQNQCVDCKFD